MNVTKNDIRKVIRDLTLNLTAQVETDYTVFSALSVSEILFISRSSASQYLNEMYNDNELIKVVSRPVLYLHREVLELTFGTKVDETDFLSLKALQKYLTNKKNMSLITNIGQNGSLSSIFNELLACLNYPPYGLTPLLVGHIGSGRSRLMHAVYQRLIELKAYKRYSFTNINCMDYISNPSFKDALAKAIVYDQDKNFDLIYLSNIQYLKDDDLTYVITLLSNHDVRIKPSHIMTSRIIMSTTPSHYAEAAPQVLYGIEALIEVPSLNMRPKQEVLEFIVAYLIKQSIKLGKDIQVTSKYLSNLINADYEFGMYTLKNRIKVSCAKASFSH
ncbi:MAG: hypothetical protein GX760_04865, partial [Erysipelothrix sp.]|nr:hypothetical protein [Erysipelothrix sp.]